MCFEILKKAGLEKDVWKELINYYKWIVSVATFVLTVSISVVSFVVEKELCWTNGFLCGWVLLVICILTNWLLIKGLVQLPIEVNKFLAGEGDNPIDYFRDKKKRMNVYAFVQNMAFLLGILLLFLSSIVNLM